MSRSSLYALLMTLYITQFLGVGFAYVGLTGILREAGMGLDQLAGISAIGTLWAIKFLWSPIIDRYGSRRFGHYRIWALIFQALMVVGFVGLIFVEPTVENYPRLLLLLAALVFFSATQDIAADALAVTLIPQQEHGMANGIQVAAGYLGNAIGGGFVVFIYDRFGWTAAVGVLAAMTSISIWQLLVTRAARQARPADRPSLRSTYAAMFGVFKDRRVRAWTLYVVPVAYTGVSIVFAVLSPALVDAGWSLTRIGLVTSVLGGIPAGIGALVGGWLINRYGLQLPMLVANCATLIGVFMLIPLFTGANNDTLTTIGIICYLAFYSAATAVIYTINMKYCRPETPGSDFTLLTCVAMLCSFVGSAIFLSLAETYGYPVVVAASIVMVILGTVLAYRHIRTYHGNDGQPGPDASPRDAAHDTAHDTTEAAPVDTAVAAPVNAGAR